MNQRIKHFKDLQEEINDESYKNKIYEVLILVLRQDNLYGDIQIGIDKKHVQDEKFVKIEFNLLDGSTLYGLDDYGYYTSFYHKERGWFEKYLIRIPDFYRYTFRIEK